LGAVWAEGGGDVVPLAGGDACEGKTLRLDNEEVGVSVFFDGEEDGAVIFAAELNFHGGAGGFDDQYWFGGSIGDGEFVGGAGAAKEEENCECYNSPFSRGMGRGMQRHG